MTRYNVQTLNAISPLGLDRLDKSRYATGNDIGEPDAIMVRSHNMHEMDIPKSVKAIARAGAGTNNIPVAKMSQRGIPVFNAPGANANAVKELVVAGMLMASRNLLPAIRFVEGLEGDDASMHKQVEAGKKKFAGTELPGRKLGIIGLGAIGGLVADAALKLGMDVLGYDPNITIDAAWRLSSQVQKAQSAEEVIKNSEFLTIHVPLLDATRDLLNEKTVAMMRPGTILLNFAREGIVNDAAVVNGIANGNIRYYVCDFPSNALKGNPAVVALPHLGASTQEAEDNCAVMVANQLRDYLEEGNIKNAVNFPDVEMRRESPYRLAIANANVPNIIGQVSTALADAGINIHNMVNKSKGEMAYTLVDTDSAPGADVIKKICGISGVLMVRELFVA